MLNEIDEMKHRGDTEGLFALLQGNRNEDWMSRLDAAEALAQLGDGRGLDYLNHMLTSSDKDIQEVVSEILEGLRDYQLEPVLQPEIVDQPNSKNWVYKIALKYPYLVAWSAFVALSLLADVLLAPALDLLLWGTRSWVPESIAILIRLFVYLLVGFFIFRIVIRHIVLPLQGIK